MAKRLSFDGYDGSKPVALPGIDAPVRGPARANSLARVLEIALQHAGLRLGYDAIMGLSGLAFSTPPWPDASTVPTVEAIAALEALSERLGGCIEIKSGETLSSDAVLDAVAASVDAGRPCIALGWGSDKDHWSIIAGYDRGKGRLIGHCLLDGPRSQYESWPPTGDVVAAIAHEPPPRGPEAVREALRAGARRWKQSGASRYRDWIAEMRLLADPPGGSHERVVELLADARTAAAEFAEQVAGYEAETPAAWLARAAELWREVVALLEARGAPFSEKAVESVATGAARADWADLLESAAALEAKAASAVRLSRSADYLPQDAARW